MNADLLKETRMSSLEITGTLALVIAAVALSGCGDAADKGQTRIVGHIENAVILPARMNGALKQAGGSLIVATLCYLLMRWDMIGYWFFPFPELLLVLLALILLLGRYTGYRLTEIKRFRVLAALTSGKS